MKTISNHFFLFDFVRFVCWFPKLLCRSGLYGSVLPSVSAELTSLPPAFPPSSPFFFFILPSFSFLLPYALFFFFPIFHPYLPSTSLLFPPHLSCPRPRVSIPPNHSSPTPEVFQCTTRARPPPLVPDAVATPASDTRQLGIVMKARRR